MNDAVSIAISALAKTISRLESNSIDEIEFLDIVVLRECAEVIARATNRELFLAIKEKKENQKFRQCQTSAVAS